MGKKSLAEVLIRVQDLLQRAQETTFEEEARTCALLAVRLMKKHGLRVVAPKRRAASPDAKVPDASERNGSWRRYAPEPRWSRAETLFCSPACSPEAGHGPDCPRYWAQR